ncbi:ABC transporter [Actinobaculum sp. 313]|nr:ABC transporter [Actinobaculum sp. 313]
MLGARTARPTLTLTVLICALLVAAVASGIKGLYPTLSERVAYAASAGESVSSAAFNGRGYGLTTLGGITAAEVGFLGQILFPLLGIVVAVRLTRREEESGRTELLTASRVGRLTPLVSAAGLMILTALATGAVMTAGMVAVGLPAAGSAWYAAAAGACILFFGAVGLLLAQLCQQARSAQQLGIVIFSIAYLVRFLVDGLELGVVWLSPLGWLPEVRSFDAPRAWPLVAYGASALLLLLASGMAAVRRDLGAGLIAPKPGPIRGSGHISAWKLALRSERTATVTWAFVACLWALLIGGFSTEMTKIINDNPSLLEAMGLERSTDLMTMMASIIIVAAAGAISVQGASHFGAEEAAGRIGLLASTRCPRARLWAGWWAATLLSSLLVVAASALILGIGTAASSGQSESIRTAVEVGSSYLASVLLIGALSAVLAAIGPRWPVVGWVAIAWTVVVGFLAEALQLPEWARDISPAHMVGVLPVDTPDPRVIVGQLAAATVLLGCSLFIFRRRSLKAG